MKSARPETADPERTDVPFFGRWRNAYAAVIAAFAVEVALFYALSRYFA